MEPGAEANAAPVANADAQSVPAPLELPAGLLRLGHYSAGDGLSGITLDRSGERPKMQVDGEADVIELTARPGWKRGVTHLKDPKGDLRLEIDDHGGVLLIGEGRPQRLYFDGFVGKLAAATITGEAPPEEVSPADQHRDALTKLSVVERLSGFAPEDAGNLDKVRAALAQAEPQMLMHVSRDVDRDVYRPSPRTIGNTDHGGTGGYWPADEQWSAGAKGLLGHGGVAIGNPNHNSGNWIKIHRPDGYPAPLKANTPGVVWQVDSSTIWFVAFDGGRYRLEWEEVATGLPAKDSWPAPLQHTLLKDDDVDFLGRTGAMPTAAYKSLAAINDAYNTCAKNGWKGFDDKVDALASKNLNWSTRNARIEQLNEQRADKVDTACTSHVDAMEDRLVNLIDARNTTRLSMFQEASKRHG